MARERLRLEYRRASELAGNPRNWRKHPKRQEGTLAALLQQVGWAGAALLNRCLPEQGWPEGTPPRLVDGHLRKRLAVARDEEMPVLVGSWTADEERLILASLDPIAIMAQPDEQKLAELTDGLSADNALIDELLDEARDEAAGLMLRDAGADESSLQKGLDSGGRKIRPVLSVSDIGVFEDALAAVRNTNRGEAIVEICRFYLTHHPPG